MLTVSPLLHEQILRTSGMPTDYEESGQVEIDWTPILPVGLPAILDLRLQSMEKMLLRPRTQVVSWGFGWFNRSNRLFSYNDRCRILA
jgi:hypothetical protein